MQKRTPAVTGCGKTSDIAVLASFRQAKSRQSVNATLYDKLNFNFIREEIASSRPSATALNNAPFGQLVGSNPGHGIRGEDRAR
jgi:hypothetical protein